jgi:hypothetical protein
MRQARKRRLFLAEILASFDESLSSMTNCFVEGKVDNHADYQTAIAMKLARGEKSRKFSLFSLVFA